MPPTAKYEQDPENVVCPHCKAIYGQGWEEIPRPNLSHSLSCISCGKTFTAWAAVETTYWTTDKEAG